MRLPSGILLNLLSLSVALTASMVGAQSSAPLASPAALADDSDLQRAEKSFQGGRFEEASRAYQAILAKTPSSVPAQLGLIRSLLRDQKLDEATAAGTKYEAASPNEAAFHTVMGEVRFRVGEMPESEREFRKAIALNAKEVRAYLGLAKLLDAFGLHRKAYEQLEKAHAIAPDDPRVQRLWLRTLPRKERIAVLERYLAEPQGEDPETLNGLRHYLEYLKAIDSTTVHACKLARPVASTEAPLEPLTIDTLRIRGWGLKVRLNDRTGTFLVDTGASGFVIGRHLAEKAGVVRIAAQDIGGIGDRGQVSGYVGYVNKLQVGELEFQDCTLTVVDRRNVAEDDGIIGADVFRAYLVSLNFRERKLKLDPLPKRPEEPAAATPSLATEENNDSSPARDKIGDEDENARKTEAKPEAVANRNLPNDRYIAPEMKTWAMVFRIGHELLVPTKVNDQPAVLFLLDTGAFANTFSKRMASRLGKVQTDERMRVRGLNGTVNQVYRAQDATLEFGGLRQKNRDTVTLDLTNISRHTGTEISGILGFNMLNLLDLQIDYRDNLVNFNYDPTKLGLPASKPGH